MNGIFNILKPTGMTSHDVVYEIRKKFNIQKVGHTGTLDPNVAGVLPIAVGKATKLTQMLIDKDKSYRCMMTFGKQISTSDTYGEVMNISDKIHSISDFDKACKSFVGEIIQVPSMYSAIKVGGRRLYKIARKGEKIENIPKRKIVINSINIIKFTGKTAIFDVSCSKGTYIRTLVEDIAKKLDDIAYMNYLIRTKSGSFDIEDSVTLSDIDEKDLISMDDIYIDGIKNIILDEKQLYRFINGLDLNPQYIKNFEYSNKNIYKIYDEKNKLVSIANVQDNKIKNIAMLNN
ncbi:tRNA pseudouridine(55) synthase [Peptoanaerobacter stomatis]|uniref:tRNA pseudouridine synthase B n=1 Tax=Peptoanaerobacter stomatis TaxID=796937 RepID=J4WFJ4_9FIRM|nr:tRNA pseudouridine(55) synthase TruB [Peptoanaerobacter stomatis]EJU24046.1 tRNA pseudouridine(55) synthase [Peptoanaerobacter stomatis]